MARLIRYEITFQYKSNIPGEKEVELHFPLEKKYSFIYEEAGMWKKVSLVLLVDPIEIQYRQVPIPNVIVDFMTIHADTDKNELVEMDGLTLTETDVEWDSQESQTL